MRFLRAAIITTGFAAVANSVAIPKIITVTKVETVIVAAEPTHMINRQLAPGFHWPTPTDPVPTAPTLWVDPWVPVPAQPTETPVETPWAPAPTMPATPPPTQGQKPDNGQGGIIAVIVLGSLMAAAAVFGTLFFGYKKLQRRSHQQKTPRQDHKPTRRNGAYDKFGQPVGKPNIVNPGAYPVHQYAGHRRSHGQKEPQQEPKPTRRNGGKYDNFGQPVGKPDIQNPGAYPVHQYGGRRHTK